SSLMDGDAVRARNVVAKHPRPAALLANADPSVVVLRGVQIAARIEGHVVGSDDGTALRADALHATGLDVDRTDLTADHLRHVDAPVGTPAEPVRAEEAARRRESFEGPAFLRAGRLLCGVPSVLKCHLHPPNL